MSDPLAVLFDLDDTLIPQDQWLSGAWSRVAAKAASDYHVPEQQFRDALEKVSKSGSGQGHIIDKALDLVEAAAPVAELVEAFLAYRAPVLSCYPGVKRVLTALRAQFRLGIVTDGFPPGQQGKLRSAGLAHAVDVVVFSDALGRGARKPSPAPFLEAARQLGVRPGQIVVIGDRPDKDIAGAVAAGMAGIRVRTGEYAAMADHPNTSAAHAGVVAACSSLWPSLLSAR